MVKALCQHYSPALMTIPSPSTPQDTSGKPPGTDLPSPEAYYPFPPPSVLAGQDVAATLRTLGFGYRAEFIQKTAKMLVDANGSSKQGHTAVEPAEEWLQTLREVPTTEARAELLKFVGVGRKVADCILLMSLDKNEVIPVDTHVHQIAMKHYGVSGSLKGKSAMTPKLYDEVSTRLSALWGEYAGWAHSVLFTSDLKSFATYGLPSPSPTPLVQTESVRISRKTKTALPTPPLTSSPNESENKRKRGRLTRDLASTKVQVPVEKQDHSGYFPPDESTLPVYDDNSLNLADRVKRRRRVKAVEVSMRRSVPCP